VEKLNDLIPETAAEAKEIGKKKHSILEERKIGPFVLDGIDMIILSFFIVLSVAALCLKLVYHPVIVSGDSMLPTYHNRNILKTSKDFTPEDIKHGSVVVFNSHDSLNREYVKRVEGLPGDRIQIIDGVLYRNGEAVEEGFEKMERAGRYVNEIELKNEYFVLGDNRNNSFDSRVFGGIEFRDIRFLITDPKPVI